MVHPIGQAAATIKSLNTEGIEKSTKVRSLNRQSGIRFLAGIPLMFSRKLTVWNPETNKHVYTSLSKSDWKKIKTLARSNESALDRMSKKSLATRKKLALEIIRKSGDTKGLTVLDRASPQQLCIIAKALTRYGKNSQYREQVLTALRAAQDQWQAMSMDPDTLEMVNEFVANDKKSTEGALKKHYAIEHQDALDQAAPARLIRSKEQFPDNFRKFVGDLISEDERDRNQSASQAADSGLDREERIKAVFQKHLGVVTALASYKIKAEENIPQLAKACGMSYDFVKNILDVTESIGSGGGGIFGNLLSPREVEASLKQFPATSFGSVAKAIDEEVERYDLQKIGDYLKDHIPQKNGNYGKFLSRVFQEYFSNLSPADRRAVISISLREAGVNDSKEAHLVAALKGSGPYLLKILQLLGDTIPSKTEDERKLKEALNQLKDSLLPVAPEIQTAMVMDLIAKQQPTIKNLTDIRSLGAASVGETLIATAELESGARKDVVLKLLKPGVDQRASRERAVMERIAREIPGMQETFAGIADQIDRELDLSREAENVVLAGVYRKAGIAYISPVKTVRKLDAAQDFMFMEKASGTTVKAQLIELRVNDLAQIRAGDVEQRVQLQDRLETGRTLSARLASLSSIWLKEALFGSGFYHGDLHSGNMMYDSQQQGGLLTLIDFGNAGTLARPERANMLKLMLAAENRYPERFIDTLGKMVGPESQKALARPENKEALRQQIAEIFSDPAISGSKRMLEAINLANNFDVAVPNSISNFARSQNMLDLAIKDLNVINQTNWQALNQNAARAVEEPASVSLSDIFKRTVKSQKKQIIALTGRDGWRMRKANEQLPLRARDGNMIPEPNRGFADVPAPQVPQAPQAGQAPQSVDKSVISRDPVSPMDSQAEGAPISQSDQLRKTEVQAERMSEVDDDFEKQVQQNRESSSFKIGSQPEAEYFLNKKLLDIYEQPLDEDDEFMQSFLAPNDEKVS
jgi:predicted unusual protein kinase regulating ubiquinone biosynthesis (AarF/ABC1/UbiB family)